MSVVIPAYNAARFIAEALQSVLAQTAPPGEILVIDDASSDATAEIAASFGATVICHTQRRGVSAARNAAIAHANGDFVALLDADDVWRPEKLERQLAAFRASAAADMVTARFSYFLHPGVERPPLLDPAVIGVPQPKTCPSAWLIAKGLFERAGGFREDLQVAEDIDWFANLRATGATIVAMDDCLVRKRVHDSNISGNFADTNRESLSTLRALLAQRRSNEAAST